MRSTLTVTMLILTLAAYTGFAGAVVAIDDTSKVDIGFRVQPLVIVTEKDDDGDGEFESDSSFKVRRGRLRLKGTITDRISGFLQTDVGSGEDGSGLDWRLIDAFVTVKLCDHASLVAGENMAPASRQNLTSSGTLLAMDRPGINYKTLTWGTRSVYAFANNTFSDSDAGLRGDVDVRDLGATLFGHTSLSDTLHVKYYLGAYDGVQLVDSEDNFRTAGRVQVNLFDAESGYYNKATYLEKGKKTVGIGLSYDQQRDVASCASVGMVDYTFYTLDAFAECPLGPGQLTLEAAIQDLDLDDATMLMVSDDPTAATVNASQSQGNGYYVQAGYLIGQWQPWVEVERWESDAADDKGSYNLYRAGVSYYMKGHNAAIKGGIEQLKADEDIGSTTEDTINSLVMGCYLTY